MLSALHIKNIAVIDEVEIEFEKGFNVLTGETGAGKSIIIDSINMVLGQRTSKDLIRFGENKAFTQAMFFIESDDIINRLSDIGIDAEDGNLLIYRDINTDGKSTSRVNGQIVTANMLKDIAKLLINIHGQHDNQSLLNPSMHINFLDDFCELKDDLHKYIEAYSEANQIEKKISELTTDENLKMQRIDMLSYQIDEIEKANLSPNEEELLKDRRELLNSAASIAAILQKSHNELYSGSEYSKSVHDTLSDIASELGGVARLDSKLDEFYNSLNSIVVELDDIIYQMRDFSDSVEYNEAEIDDIEHRLDLINNLKRKYGKSIEEILLYLDNAKGELDKITQSEDEINALNKKLAMCKREEEELANVLSKKRKTGANILESKILKELSDLDMNNVNFKVDIKQSDFTSNGADNVEFLISTNAGEPLKPLSKIASGGEMSRIMLAIKSILADADEVSTLIFDEIDTGVSGRAANKISEKLSNISAKKQVICITHLAQIAVMADSHFLIEKDVVNKKTQTSVKLLSGKDREHELARIIAGAYITDTTLKNAREMIKQARALKGE